jgi:hypothetical protein
MLIHFLLAFETNEALEYYPSNKINAPIKWLILSLGLRQIMANTKTFDIHSAHHSDLD